MAVCEIRVHSSDSSRMDLIIPREQCFYLRAEIAADRQKWLVALGSSKACLGDSATKRPREMLPDSESLSQKLSELRLFCDLLMQQVVDVQGGVNPDDQGCAPDMEKLSTACSVLHGTCTHICSTLDECMKYASTTLDPPLPVLPTDIVGTKLPQARKVKRSLSHSGVQTPQRILESPRQADGVTVLRNLEEMVMVRSHTWEPQPHLPSSNNTKSKEGLLPASHTAEHVRTPVTITHC
ncbi:hypothetical protein FKM82_009470 [Ascaphus truei]